VKRTNDSEVNISELLDQFYPEPIGYLQLGEFEPVLVPPPPYGGLLNHHKHMTVTVESHYREKVDVRVHRCFQDGDWYCREITLVTTQSKRVVQYGIVRLDTTTLEPEVWQKINSQEVPLGRVLIEHNVLREVQLCGLWRIQAGPALAALLQVAVGQRVWGRTALIYCNGEPAIKLLEILSPTGAFA
jgi:chorismate-pyruvate lyase